MTATHSPRGGSEPVLPLIPVHPGGLRNLVAAWLVAMAGMFVVGGCTTPEGSMNTNPAAPLRGTQWNLVDAGGESVPAGLPGDREPFLRLDPDKEQANGYSGVNNFFGGFDTSGTTLRFKQLRSTRRAGPPAAMAVESVFLKALGATASYRIAGNTLELFDADGKPLARLAASAAP